MYQLSIYQLIHQYQQMSNKYRIETQYSKKIHRKRQQNTRQALELLGRLKARRQKQIQIEKIPEKLNQYCKEQLYNPQDQLLLLISKQKQLYDSTEQSMLAIWKQLIAKAEKQNSLVHTIVVSWNEQYLKLKQQKTQLTTLIDKINFQKRVLQQQTVLLQEKLKLFSEKQKQQKYCFHSQQFQPILSKNQSFENQSNLLSQMDQNIFGIQRNGAKSSETKYLEIIIENLQTKIQQLEQENYKKAKEVNQNQRQVIMLRQMLEKNKISAHYDCQTISFGNIGQSVWVTEQDYHNQNLSAPKLLIEQKFQELEEISKKLEQQLIKQRYYKDLLKQQRIEILKSNEEQKKKINQLTDKCSILQKSIENLKQKLRDQLQKNDYNQYKINYLQKQQENNTKKLSMRLKKTYEQSATTKSLSFFRRHSMDRPIKIHEMTQSSMFDSLIN